VSESSFVVITSPSEATSIGWAITSNSLARSKWPSLIGPPDGWKIRSTSVSPCQALIS